eukprot:m.30169 g.30169  ORF g.30169 m.30169 type:complete len:354 (+) comp12198_c0_seq2:155-1216(+)
MSVVELLKSVPVSSIVPAGPIVCLKSTDNPRDAFKQLADANIRSAPVYDERTSRYIGFLDVRDLMAFIVYENGEPELRKAAAEKGTTTEFIERMLTASAKMYDLPMEAHPSKRLKHDNAKSGSETVLGVPKRESLGHAWGVTLSTLARRHGFRCVGTDATLDDVAKLLVHKGCHRVPVINMDGEVVNIISQSTIVKFLEEHNGRLGGLGAHTVAQSACGTSPVLTVKQSATVLDTLNLMAVNDIMGVAIVDDAGKLLANTSASDLKLFLQEPSTSIHSSILSFISKVRQHDLKAVHPAMSVTAKDTLSHVIGRLAAARVHRLFVVDHGRPVSVISLTDILRYIYLVSLVKGDE